MIKLSLYGNYAKHGNTARCIQQRAFTRGHNSLALALALLLVSLYSHTRSSLAFSMLVGPKLIIIAYTKNSCKRNDEKPR